MAQRNEMGELREPVNHGQQNTFAMDLWQRLDEIHGGVRPNARQHRQGLQQTSSVERFSLVPLAHRTRPHVVPYDAAIVLNEKLRMKPEQGLLHSLVASCVSEP
jgi:hypothetical protein